MQAIAPRRRSTGVAPGFIAYAILLLGAFAYLLPPQVALQVAPYYGSTLFGVACFAAFPFLVFAGGWSAPTNWVVAAASAYGLLAAGAMESFQSGTRAAPGLRVLLEDALQFSAFAAGGSLAALSPNLLESLLRRCSLAAFASAVLQMSLTMVGALPSQWGDELGRFGSPSIYLACSMAICFGPAVFLQVRGTWFGLALVGMQVVTGLASQTRTLLVNAVLLLLVLVLVDRSRRVPRVAMLAWIVMLTAAAVCFVAALVKVADLRGTDVLDPTGRDEEIVSLLREMSGPELAFGVGLGRGFVRYGFDTEREEREVLKSNTHLLSGTFLIKFGVPLGITMTALIACLCLRGCLRAWYRREMTLPVALLACTLLESALAGLYKPVTMFALGAAVSLSFDPSTRSAVRRRRATVPAGGSVPLLPSTIG